MTLHMGTKGLCENVFEFNLVCLLTLFLGRALGIYVLVWSIWSLVRDFISIVAQLSVALVVGVSLPTLQPVKMTCLILAITNSSKTFT